MPQRLTTEVRIGYGWYRTETDAELVRHCEPVLRKCYDVCPGLIGISVRSDRTGTTHRHTWTLTVPEGADTTALAAVAADLPGEVQFR